MSNQAVPSSGLHAALQALQNATSEDRNRINLAFQTVFTLIATERRKSSIARHLAPVKSLAGPHRYEGGAEDVLQEIGITIWRNRFAYRGETEGEAWAWIQSLTSARSTEAVRKPLRRNDFWKPIALRVGQTLAKDRAKRRPGRGDDPDNAGGENPFDGA